MRNCHYWKLAGARSAPSEIVVFDCETWHGDRATVAGGEWHTLRLGCALAYRLEKGTRTRQKRITFRTAEEFWALVRSRLDKRRPVWVFAHNAAYDLGCVSGWKFITDSGVIVEKAAVSGQILFIKCVLDGCGITFCDTLNYYRCSLEQLGRSVGIHKGQMPDQSAPDSEWESYCRQDVEVTAAGVDALIAFTRKEELGPWQPSIAGLSFSGFRSRFMREKVLVHDKVPVLRLERGAYYGGLVDCARIGRAPADAVYELDVCSMYPAVCQNDMPTVLKGWTRNIGQRKLVELAQKYMLCAEVTVESSDTTYPIRLKDGTYHPVGRFQTTLAHPELMDAFKAGHVKWVHAAAWYERKPLFREYMRHFVGMKTKYKRAGDDAYSTLCKYYANSLYGKTGQLTPTWREWGRDSLETLEERHGLAPGTLSDKYLKPPDLYELEETVRVPELREPIEVRDYFGVVEVRCGESESRDSCPVIAATVTSYARQLLRGYQRTAGRGNWYYCDTDSIWTNRQGYENLVSAGFVRDEELGYLSLKKVHDYLIVYGPKDYECPGVRRLKGIRPRATPTDSGGWSQLHFPSATAQIKSGREGGVFVARVTKTLRRTLTKSVALPNGETRPLVFPQENPELKVLAKRPAKRRVKK